MPARAALALVSLDLAPRQGGRARLVVRVCVGVHLVPSITKPPHFAPEQPGHSEVDFPVLDAEAVRSPTAEGPFRFHEPCDELGPRAIGDAIDELDRADRRQRVTGVCDFGSRELREGLLSVVEEKRSRKRVEELLRG